jgi:hypothetical protein
MRVFLAVLLAFFVTQPLFAAAPSDPNGSFDLDLSLRVDVPTEVLISTEYDLKLAITNETDERSTRLRGERGRGTAVLADGGVVEPGHVTAHRVGHGRNDAGGV